MIISDITIFTVSVNHHHHISSNMRTEPFEQLFEATMKAGWHQQGTNQNPWLLYKYLFTLVSTG